MGPIGEDTQTRGGIQQKKLRVSRRRRSPDIGRGEVGEYDTMYCQGWLSLSSKPTRRSIHGAPHDADIGSSPLPSSPAHSLSSALETQGLLVEFAGFQ